MQANRVPLKDISSNTNQESCCDQKNCKTSRLGFTNYYCETEPSVQDISKVKINGNNEMNKDEEFLKVSDKDDDNEDEREFEFCEEI